MRETWSPVELWPSLMRTKAPAGILSLVYAGIEVDPGAMKMFPGAVLVRNRGNSRWLAKLRNELGLSRGLHSAAILYFCSVESDPASIAIVAAANAGLRLSPAMVSASVERGAGMSFRDFTIIFLRSSRPVTEVVVMSARAVVAK